jgi:hypothetical protein
MLSRENLDRNSPYLFWGNIWACIDGGKLRGRSARKADLWIKSPNLEIRKSRSDHYNMMESTVTVGGYSLLHICLLALKCFNPTWCHDDVINCLHLWVVITLGIYSCSLTCGSMRQLVKELSVLISNKHHKRPLTGPLGSFVCDGHPTLRNYPFTFRKLYVFDRIRDEL